VIYQNCNLGNIHGFGFEIVDIVREHLNQSLVVSDVGFGTVSEGTPVYRQPDAFDPIRCFVVTKPLDAILALQVFLTAWESIIIRVVHFGFFGLVRALCRGVYP